MRVFLLLIAMTVLATSGCHHKKTTKPPPAMSGTPTNAFSAVPGETMPAPAPALPPVVSPSETKTTSAPPPVVVHQSKPAPAPAPASKVVVSPDNSYVGKVATVNSAARFVVLSFPAGHMPPLDQKLNVSRRGTKIGEVRITGPQLDENIVADIITGEADAGDEVASR